LDNENKSFPSDIRKAVSCQEHPKRLANVRSKPFLLRLPPELHEWLKNNIKDQTINEFILTSIKERLKASKAHYFLISYAEK
jgi:predicted HicB family RNase H-like nuclease